MFYKYKIDIGAPYIETGILLGLNKLDIKNQLLIHPNLKRILQISEIEKPFMSTGTLHFYPKQEEYKWCLLDCDEEICKYYRYLLNKEGIKLQRPKHKAHISLIRCEKILNIGNWGNDNNKIIHFIYNNEIYNNGIYYWVDVYSLQFNNIRVQFGLNPWIEFGYHLSIGRI